MNSHNVDILQWIYFLLAIDPAVCPDYELYLPGIEVRGFYVI